MLYVESRKVSWPEVKKNFWPWNFLYDVYKLFVWGHVRCLQTEVSQKKNRSVEKDSVRFRVKVMIELGFDFKTFCIGNREHRWIHV